MPIIAPPLALVVFTLLFLYPLLGYPALMWIWSKVRRAEPEPPEPVEYPEIALIICALNEARVIGDKMENSLQLGYPAGRLHIVVVNDGSTDGTADIVRRYADRGVELIDRSERRGKVTNLNEVIQGRPEPLIALSDANVIYDPQCLRLLVRHFQDPSVGCVSGKVVLIDTTKALNEGEGQYYSLEWFLQEEAGRMYSMVGADGAMHAFRRHLYRPCPTDTLIEDLVMPVQIVRQGFRCLMEPRALAREEGPSSSQEEFRRKVRIAAGAAQAVIRGNGLPGEKAPLRFWFLFISHKLLRWASPLMALGVVISAALTWTNPWSQLVLAGSFLLAVLALVRWRNPIDHRMLNIPYYFVFGQAAVLYGLWRGATGRQSVLWAKVNR
jgi:poly-beta-1,6-N-acetyl-D-glucosamine synthase